MRIAKKLQLALRALLLKAGEVETDNGKLIWEGEDALTEGTEVFIEREENGEVEIVPAPDGTYSTDEYVYEVKDGKVASIREAEQAPSAEEETPADEPDENVETAEETPAEDPADENDEEQPESLEDRVERLEASMGEIVAGMEQFINALSNLEGRIEALEAKVASLEEPAGDPANDRDEEFSDQKPSRLSYLRKK